MSIVLASALGLLIALMRLSGNPLAAGTRPCASWRWCATRRSSCRSSSSTSQCCRACRRRARASCSAWGFFLNVRGLLMPSPTLDPRMLLLGGVLLALAVIGWIARPPGSIAGVLLGPLLMLAWLIAAAFSADWELPALRGFNFTGGLRIPPELLALWLGISIYTSAFISEIIRAAILGIAHGQTEAALSLGLSRGLTMYLVILPQAMRIADPAADQPIPQHHQVHHTRRGDRLSRRAADLRPHGAEPVGSRGGGDDAADRRVPVDQPHDVGGDEPLE